MFVGKCPIRINRRSSVASQLQKQNVDDEQVMRLRKDLLQQIWPSDAIVTQNDDPRHKSSGVDSQKDETERRSA